MWTAEVYVFESFLILLESIDAYPPKFDLFLKMLTIISMITVQSKIEAHAHDHKKLLNSIYCYFCENKFFN